MSLRALGACAVLAALAGCGSLVPEASREIEGVRFESTADAYRPGEIVGLRLTNGSSAAYVYNFCTAYLELDANGSWTVAGSAEGCPLYGVLLPVGTEASYQEPLPESLAMGWYRFSMGVPGTDEVLHTQRFRVTP